MNNQEGKKPFQRKPAWLKAQTANTSTSHEVKKLLRDYNLHTVCEEAGCPNCGECFSRRTATFLIMGSVCSRNCRFCQVVSGCPQPLDEEEPARIAQAVAVLGLRHVVITSVTRDDLPDGGSAHFSRVIRAIRELSADADHTGANSAAEKLGDSDRQMPVIEVLIPDFQGDFSALRTVVEARPSILNHNIETVPALYHTVRPEADYVRSLQLLSRVKQINPDMLTKSGLMLGLGEQQEEVIQTLKDLRAHACDLVTIGQYLAPSKNHLPVHEYIHPDVFALIRKEALAMGFKAVASGPLVRSSYMAEQVAGDLVLKREGKKTEN